MDGARSLSIDDVIKTLSEGKSIKQLILERQANTVGGTFHFSKEPELIHMLEELGEGSPVEVANPFRKSPTP